ncbi:MAG: hypothetical protein ACK5LV_06495 [Lachnospirales bacterium]
MADEEKLDVDAEEVEDKKGKKGKKDKKSKENKGPSPKDIEKEAKKRFKEEQKANKIKDKEDKKNAKFEKRQKKLERKRNWKMSKARKFVWKTIPLLLLIFVFAVVFLNIFDIRDKYLREYLEKIPVIGTMLPEPTDSSIAHNKTKEEVEVENQTLLSENQSLNEQAALLEEELESANDEIDRLKEFEDQYLAFLQEKEEFDTMVASEEPDEFISFYESMYAENAERVYADLKGIAIDSEEFEDYINTFSAMDPSSVAPIMEEMMITDIDLVVSILEELSSSVAGDILAEMPAEQAAILAKLMAPSLPN